MMFAINNKNIFLLILAFVYCSNIIFSQKIFETKQGTVIINTKYVDSSLNSASKSVIMRLDYEDARFSMEVKLNSFKTGIDSLDKLVEYSKLKFYFDALLGLSEIDTKSHSIQKFNFTGTVFSNESKKKINVLGTGTIQHISEKSEIASCLLWLDFTFNSRKLNWNLPLYKIDEILHVQIVQAILSRNK